ncbi:MAG TPA: DUF2934 domain-containing protein [Gaiellaceae bacterium]|nr:DUF2934 domain-containing protein [Gaiellaceae bacterium]
MRKAAPKRARTPKAVSPPAHEHVAERAYYISLEAGGDPFENWLRAERELAAR